MATLDLSTAVILYGEGSYSPLTRGRLIPGPSGPVPAAGYLTFIFPDLVLDPVVTYRIEVEYQDNANNNGGLGLYSASAPTEAAVDSSNWWELADIGAYEGYGVASFVIGPGLQQWAPAIIDNERYVTWTTYGGISVLAIRFRVEGTEESPGPATVDFPCTYVWQRDNLTYPWDAQFDGNDWSPLQTVGVTTNWGYLVPGSGNLLDVSDLSDIYVGGFLADRSHSRFGQDFDPARSIGLSTANPDLYGPPIGVIEVDGSITYNSDPSGLTGHWSDEDEMVVKFEGPTPAGISLENSRFVVHHYVAGGLPRLWIDWQNPGGPHRSAYIPLRNIGDYKWVEDTASLPIDFPIQRVLDGDEFVVHSTIYGGIWQGLYAYMAFRFGMAPAITGRPDNVRRRFVD